MMGTMRIFLRANERLFLNGAVIRVDRKVSLELMNDATFLMEGHVMQKEEATTPLKQLYFVIQVLLMDPNVEAETTKLFREMIGNLLEATSSPDLRSGIKNVDVEVSTGKVFAALKILRGLFEIEEGILNAGKPIVNGEIAAGSKNMASDLAQQKV